MTDPAQRPRTVVSGARLAAAAGFVASARDGTGSDLTVERAVARGSRGVNAVELHGRVRAAGSPGQRFTGHGFLTAVHGLRQQSLFAGGTGSLATALFTVRATGELTARTLGRTVQAIDVTGTLAIYRRREPGADWASDGSFAEGLPLAEYALTLRDALSIFAYGRRLPSLTGEVRQTYAGTLDGKPAGARFGVVGQVWRMLGTGLAALPGVSRLDEVEIDGSWGNV